MSLLETIQSPLDLRNLPTEKLPDLAAEIRDFMIDIVSRQGGHLASSLGAVELAIALHYCYNTPEDKILWDVGHQAYAHKILTGRREQMNGIRQEGGLSGFPRTVESDYDALSVGHASTSISAALGYAIGRDLKKQKHSVVAVIGDGSLSGGLALEGLNNAGSQATNLTVVLNDNRMSISKNVGALSRYLTRVITDRRFNKLKSDVYELLGHMSDVGKRIRSLVHNVDDTLKHIVIPGKLFEDMGLRYLGPIDGHNLSEMIEVFRFARSSTEGPVLLHVITKKGKGYTFAENDATKYHGIGKFSRDTGNVLSGAKKAPSYSEIFGKTLVEIGQKRKDVVAITAAMPDGTGLSHFRDAFPDRFHDVGIAEEHAVTFAAGLALAGLRPVVALYSTFLQRAYDQLIHDVALDNLNVVFGIDRAGIVGEDGPTHHGVFDLSFLRTIPNVTIMAPRNEAELRNMLYTAIHHLSGPVFIRYPRGAGVGVELHKAFTAVDLYRPAVVHEGKECAVVAIGDCWQLGENAAKLLRAKGIDAAYIDARFAKPLDTDFYAALFKSYSHIITLEGNSQAGGFGSAILELAARSEHNPRILPLGYPDAFIQHGALRYLLEQMKLTPEHIANHVVRFLELKPTKA